MEMLEKLKKNNGATMSDVVVAMLIITLFTGILTTSFLNIYKNNISIRMNALAVNYAIKILEDIDKKTYEEVTNELNDSINQNYQLQQGYSASINIQNYNENDENKEDIIKIVTVNIKYKVIDTDEEYVVRKLKIREM